MPPTRCKRLVSRLFFARVAGAASVGVEPRLVLRDHVQVGLLLRELRPRAGFVLASGAELSGGTLDRAIAIGQLRAHGMLPCLRTCEVGHAKLPVRQATGLVVAHRCRMGNSLGTFLLGAALRVVGGFERTYGRTELRRSVLDLSIPVLAQGLERVLRIPRHS